MNNQLTIFAVLVVAFFGSIYYNETQKQNVIYAIADAEAAKKARYERQEREMNEAARLAAIERAKYKDSIEHDSNPKTNSYNIIMTGRESFDPDRGDKLKYAWFQKSGDDVKLSSTTDATVTFSAITGEYTFALTATDDYGLSTTASKTVKIGPEPNASPVVIIDVRKDQ